MRHLLPKISYFKLTLLLTLYFTFVVNLPILLHFYRILHALPAYNLAFALSIPVALFAALNFVFTPFSFRPLLKPFFIIVLPVSALASFAMMTFQIVFDRGMIENIMETQSAEATSYLNLKVVLWFVFTGVLPAILLFLTPVSYEKTPLHRLGVRLVSMVISLLVVASVAGVFYKDYASVGRNNRTLNLEIVPTNYLYSAFQYMNHRYFTPKMPFRTIGDDAKLVQQPGQKPNLVFLVVGETARAQNQSWNGYSKPTNQFTQAIPDVVNFSKMTSCGTATAISVPCMFSNMKRTSYDANRARNSEGLLDILHKAGVSVFWKDNDEGCKGVCDRVPNVIIDTKNDGKYCDGDTCYDMALMQNIDNDIKPDGKNTLIALHLIGSHGPTYSRRYPPEFRKFTPDCPRSDIENCTQEQLVNTYDNTVLYTDYLVSQVIEKAKQYQDKYNVAVIYLSDHGESLGENGLYLHGTPYRVAPAQQTHVPMLFWLSESYAKAQGIDMQCLKTNAANKDVSQDNLFHTVLSAMNVQTSERDPQLDIFAACKASR
ncbi:phosphoethanolamine transferase [Rahnella bonaserana]|uniref:Phosphoethanolamine--lipid A transferase n=1 Tax=Rahnella bonaserana TaxID=2816248 RepID=A0ABS6LUY5_9GAMM|nr:phosphoethanolamine--lipid A transferase [Rahnella bonaserana]MBU9855920.1 phosphoethanolamine--lipid A transferase [Rahnella bonaserana]MCL9641289.1 phosphoethanolamine--lipid A transferase [Rahnella victoriana]